VQPRRASCAPRCPRHARAVQPPWMPRGRVRPAPPTARPRDGALPTPHQLDGGSRVSKEPSHNGADVYDLAGATSKASGSSTKKEETNTLPPARPPVPEAAMYRGVLGDIVLAADPTTEADPVGVLASLLAGT